MSRRSRHKTPLVVSSVGGDTPERPARWFLWLVAGPHGDGPVREHEVTAGETRVGRREDLAPPAGLRLDDPGASRHHATLRRSADGAHLELVDEGSTNGTRVEGARLDDACHLRDGDVIRMADSVLVVGREPLAPPDEPTLGLAGRSPSLSRLRGLIRRAAPSDLPVLVMGPTGTGKELVARAIHDLSGRGGRRISLNCGGLPGTLVEDALFGHVKGAFTGATSDEPGAFVQAHRGTLFLDEIGELPLGDQPKLLRALDTGEVTPVGATRSRRVDVRVVAATNRPLLEAVDEGGFRDDLFARLAGIVLETPPLSARRVDVLPLFRRFLPADLRALPVTPDFAEALLLYSWPRNVRELRRLAERLGVLHPKARRFEPAMLDPAIRRPAAGARAAPDAAPAPSGDAAPWPPSRARLVDLLDRAGGNVSIVAERVGRNRKQVYRWMDKLGVPRGTGR